MIFVRATIALTPAFSHKRASGITGSLRDVNGVLRL